MRVESWTVTFASVPESALTVSEFPSTAVIVPIARVELDGVAGVSCATEIQLSVKTIGESIKNEKRFICFRVVFTPAVPTSRVLVGRAECLNCIYYPIGRI